MAARRAVAVGAVSMLLGASVLEARDVERLGSISPPFPSEGQPAVAPVLRLAWLDVSGITTAVVGIAQSEALSVLERMGLDVEWRRVRPSEAARPWEIQVVLVDRLLVDSDTKRPILGETSAASRRFPVVWVLLPGVRATLHLSPRAPASAAPSLREIRDVGLAVGRVVAHEVVHVVAPGLSHGRGLMSRALGRRQLTAPRISIEPGLAVVVRTALRGAPAPFAGDPGTLAASGSIAAALQAEEGPHR